MRMLVLGVMACLLLFFVVGGVAVYYGHLSIEAYATVGGIVGTLVSIVQLASFASPRLTATDVQKVGSDLLMQVAAANKEVENYEQKLTRSKEEIEALELKKAEVELLIRKASARIFFQDQLLRATSQIEEFLDSHQNFKDMISKYSEMKENLGSLDEEIKSDKNYDLLVSVMDAISMNRNEAISRERDEYSISIGLPGMGINVHLGVVTRWILRALGN